MGRMSRFSWISVSARLALIVAMALLALAAVTASSL